jgi:uncharacterized protein YhaN
MRIARLDLLAFGHFSEVSLELDGLGVGKTGPTILYGDNETGKSTVLEAVRCLLFGFERRSSHAFLHAQPNLRVGARLVHADGSDLELIRLKKNKNTLRSPSDEILDEGTVLPYLRGMDRSSFGLFGLDHRELRAGGKALLEQQGDVGKALYSAATGNPRVPEVMARLEQQAQVIYKSRGSKLELNLLIKGFKEARLASSKQALSAGEWDKQRKEIETLEREVEELKRQQRAAETELDNLKRIARVRPDLAERAQRLGKLAELEEVPRLGDDFLQQRRELETRLSAAKADLANSEAQLAQHEEELAGLDVPDILLEQAGVIDALQQDLGAVEEAKPDRGKLEGKRAIMRSEAHDLWENLQPGRDFSEIEVLRPLGNRFKRLDKLAQEHDRLTGDLRRLTSEQEQLQAALKADRERLGERGVGKEADSLLAAVQAARKGSDLDEIIAQGETVLAGAVSKVARECGRLTGFGGTPEELAALALPTHETLDRADEDLRELTARGKRIREEEARFEQDLASVQDRLEVLQRSEVPSEQELGEAREHREQGWTLIKRSWIDGLDVAQEARAYGVGRDGEDTPLHAAYEQSVGRADEVVDRLRNDTTAVMERLDKSVKQSRLNEQLAALRDQRERLVRDQDAHQQRWVETWAGCTLVGEPQSPREMKVWQKRAVELQVAADGIEHQRDELERQQDRRRGLVKSLNGVLAGAASASAELLGPLLEAAEEQLAKTEARSKERHHFEQRTEDAEQKLLKLQGSLKSTQTELENWEIKWADALAGVDLPANLAERPAAVVDFAEEIGEIVAKLENAKKEELRISGIEMRAEEFAEKVRRMVEGLGAQIAEKVLGRVGDREAAEMALHLKGLVESARAAQSTQRRVQKGRKSAVEALATAQRQLAVLGKKRAELATLARLADGLEGAELEEAFAGAERKASEYRKAHERVEDLEASLAREGTGVQELQAEVDAADAKGLDGVTLAAEQSDLEDRIEVLRNRYDELNRRLGSLQGDFEKHGTAEAQAVGQAALAEQKAAAVADSARTWLRLRAAHNLLAVQLDRFRAQNEAPLLRRASELFTALTRGSFAGLRSEPDDGRAVLLGLRPDGPVGSREVEVEGMSDGTLDQLYLALRLATLENHFTETGVEPLPLVADDVLINFDDERAEATCRVLADLATRTQVLLFTHHRSVAALADRVEGAHLVELPAI